MKPFTAMLALAVVVAAAAPLSADEVPHMLLVQGLRDRRMPDLAIEYLQKLQANAPAELAPLIPLELARTRLDLANLEPEANRRNALLVQARGEFEGFVKNNPGHALAASANVEIARVIAMQGKAKLTEAIREEGAGAQKNLANHARKLFVEAQTKLEEAGKQITIQLGNLPDPPTTPQERAARQSLENAKLQAEFEQGMSLMDQAGTYLTANELVSRAEKINEAKDKFFSKVAGRDPRNPLCWQARVWAGRCNQEIDNPIEALKEYDAVLSEKGDYAETAKRLVRYFRIDMIKKGNYKVPGQKDTFAAIQKEGEDWLREYRRYQYTSEGFGMRWEVGCACYDQAIKIPLGANKVPTTQARDLYKLAEAQFKILADTENEYTLRAKNRRMNIILTTAIQETKDNPDKLVRFEQCYIRAQYEAYQIDEEQKAYDKFILDFPPNPLPAQEEDKKKRTEDLTANRKKHYQTILTCLNRALVLAPNDKDVPPQDLTDVKAMRAYVHLALGDFHAAAILGEHLARTEPQSNRASASAGYALQAYAQVAAKAGDQDVAADRKCIRRLSEFMERTWPDDPSTDFARHQLGSILLQEDNYPMAIEVFSRISNGYSHLPQARYQMALTALDLVKDPEKLSSMTEEGLQNAGPVVFGAALGDIADLSSEMEKILKLVHGPIVDARRKIYQAKALQALDGIPEVSANVVDPDTAQVYLLAKIQLGSMLFDIAKTAGEEAAKAENKAARMKDVDAKFDRLETLAASLTKLHPQLPLTTKVRDEVVPTVEALALYAKYGRAAAHMAAGNMPQVLTISDPIVNDIKKAMDEGKAPTDKFGNLRRALVVLSLRANLQLGNGNRAKVLLDLVQKSATQDQVPGGATSILIQIVQELKGQIEELGQANDPGVEKLKASIASFMDALAGQEDLPAETILFLASSYSSLDRHDKAMGLLTKHEKLFPDLGDFAEVPPVLGAQEPKPLTEEEEKDQNKLAEYKKKLEDFQKVLAEHQNKMDAYNTRKQEHDRKALVARSYKLMRVRALRLGAAEFTGEEKKKHLEKAKAELDVLILKADWAKKSLDVRKEKVQILEDMEFYGGLAGAIKGWDDLMKQNPKNNAQMLVQYFDAYYHLVYCLYKNALKVTDQTKRDAMLKQAVGVLRKLETTQPNMGADYLKKRYEDLLQKETVLKEWYLKEGGGNLVAGKK